jgi:hypothetical protein
MVFAQRRFFSVFVACTLALALLRLAPSSGGSVSQAASTGSTNLTNVTNAQAQQIICYPCLHFYGSNYSWMYTATNYWYQQNVVWCGIASIEAIQRYDWLYYNGGNPQHDGNETAIYNRLNSYTSPWGSGKGGYLKSG